MLTFSFAPFSFWWLMPLGMIGFVRLLNQVKRQQAFKLSFVFGLGWFGAGVSWVHVSIEQFGGLPLVGSLGLMILLCGYLALFPALFGYLLKRFFTFKHWPMAAGFLWFLLEWLRSWLFTGFPWLSIGYSQVEGAFSGWMPIIGETGVSALMVVIACTLLWLIQAKKAFQSAVFALIAVFSGVLLNQIEWVKPTGQNASIAMVQGNIKQELRWVPEQDKPTMDKYLKLTEGLWHNQVIIWPEAAIPKLEATALLYLHDLDQQAADTQTGLLTGIVNYNFESKQVYNNIIVVGKHAKTDSAGHYRYEHANRYAKHHLLPIGEFIPFEDWLRGLAPIFDLPMSSFNRGDYQQGNLRVNGYYLASALCFEIAFPRQVRDNLYSHTNFILTLSNDAWFGESHGPAQHMEIAQVRAKEFGLPVLRATNTGITAFVDHRGNIQAQAEPFVDATLQSQVALVKGYTLYRKAGDWPMWILTLLGFVMALVMSKHKKIGHI